MTKNILKVSTVAQKVLFEQEYVGQFSDGFWENEPSEGWRHWCNVEVVVVDNEDEVGRNFYASKDNYGLNNRNLLDYVGERMLTYVNLAILAPGLVDSGLLHWPYNQKMLEMMADSNSNYFIGKTRSLIDAGMTAEIMAEAVKHKLYTMKDMRQDITKLRKAMKTKK